MSAAPCEIPLEEGIALRGQLWKGGPNWAVLVHEPGPSHDLDDWRGLVPYLLGAGAGVLAIDLRGHGASDGDWDPGRDAVDIARAVGWLRARAAGAPIVVTVIGAGQSAIAGLMAVERARGDGVILLSPADPGEAIPRGPGVPKLILAAAHAPGERDAAARLRAASIGPALVVSLPAAGTGAALLEGEAGPTCREHILAFLRERALTAAYGDQAGAPPADLFLRRLGIDPKGVER